MLGMSVECNSGIRMMVKALVDSTKDVTAQFKGRLINFGC